jgi:hypothetical protein
VPPAPAGPGQIVHHPLALPSRGPRLRLSKNAVDLAARQRPTIQESSTEPRTLPLRARQARSPPVHRRPLSLRPTVVPILVDLRTTRSVVTDSSRRLPTSSRCTLADIVGGGAHAQPWSPPQGRLQLSRRPDDNTSARSGYSLVLHVVDEDQCAKGQLQEGCS